MTEALVGLMAMLLLSFMRVPLAFAMGFVGFVGLGLVRGWHPAAASAAQVIYETGFAYTLSVVPLFILMGNFVARAGLAHELFRAAYAFVGHVRGGLAHATILACAVALGAVAWLMWSKAGQMIDAGDTTAQLKIAQGPFVYLMSALCAVTAMVHALLVLQPVPHHHVGVEEEPSPPAGGVA